MASSATTPSPAPSSVAWSVAHAVPGRLRARYPVHWLRQHGAAVEAGLRTLSGVHRVEARPTTGSVCVDYDATRLPPRVLRAALTELAGASPATTPASPRAAEPTVRPVAGLAVVAAAAGLAAVWLPLGASIRTGLVAVSAAPPLARALTSLGAGRGLGGEVLEAATFGLLLARGHVVPAGLLGVLRALGDWLVARRVGSARRSLRQALEWLPARVTRVENGTRRVVAASALTVGDIVAVGARALVPADGVVVDGEALIGQQTVTGEGLPVERRPGDRVFAATFVEDGEVLVRVDRLGADSTAGRIIRALETAATAKSDLQRFAEDLADRQAPRTLVLAAVGALTARSVNAGVAVLVADYGMAARVAIPSAFASAMTRLARRGILVKRAGALEDLARVDTVVFDKTGTLTTGAPHVSRVITYADVRDLDVIGLAAAAERGFTHPIARAVRRLAEERRVIVPRREPAAPVHSLGAEVRVGGTSVHVGGRRFMHERGIDVSAADADEAAAHAAGGAATFVAIDGHVAGLLVLHDELREDAPAAVRALRARQGIRGVIMVSGDHAQPTRLIGESLGLDERHAEALPEDKAALIRRLRGRGRVVAMVGDGVNDALALDAADVGIAVRGEPAIVAEAADVVLVRGGLHGVVQGVDVARDVIAQVRRSIRLAARANLAVVGLASLGLATPAASIALSRGLSLGAALLPAGRR